MREEQPPPCTHKDCGRYETEGARFIRELPDGSKEYIQIWYIHCSCCDKIIESYEQKV